MEKRVERKGQEGEKESSYRRSRSARGDGGRDKKNHRRRGPMLEIKKKAILCPAGKRESVLRGSEKGSTYDYPTDL